MKNVHMCYIRVIEGKIENLKIEGKTRVSTLIFIQGCHSISISKFPDFSLTFNHFPDPFGRPILAIFIHQLFEDCAQIFELADLIFKEKS